MAAKSTKNRKAALGKFDREHQHTLAEAVGVVKAVANAKFDESVDLAVRLGVNPKHADQMVRGALVLPHGTGRTVRVAVFARGEKEKQARDAGADLVGGEDLAQKITEGNIEFDRVIATPDMMGVVGKLGRVLGPRGLMPNPKVGTVTMDVTRAVQEAKAGKVEYRVDKAGVVHCRIGRVSFDAEKIISNGRALLDDLLAKKPPTAKGVYIRSVGISSTMGPGVKIDPTTVEAIKGHFDRGTSAVFLDFSGMTVAEVSHLRSEFRKQGVTYKVLKNSLVRRALGDAPYAQKLSKTLKGMTGVAFSGEEPGAAARVLKTLVKENEKIKIKAGLLDGQVLDAKTVENQLASLPGKNEARAMLLATLMAPAQRFVMLLNTPAGNFVRLLEAKKAKGGG